MQTPQEQKAFYDAKWPELKVAAETHGAQGVIDAIAAHQDPLERRVLHMFVRQGLVMGDWQGKTLDAAVAVAKAGIAEFLQQAEGETNEDDKKKRINGANVISYNLSADLADCWPGDDAPRTKAHFEAGLAAAEDCVRWRRELGNPPHTLSMAYWAKGMHELSLGQTTASCESFTRSLAEAQESARLEDQTDAVDPAGTFSVILGAGYLALAKMARGDEGAEGDYEQALGVFRQQLEDEKKAGDAQFGIDQLETVRTKLQAE